jgi:hypothetical protein
MPDKSSIPQSVYRQHIQRAKSALNYFLFFRPYTKLMNKTTALFLQDIINIASLPSTTKKDIEYKEGVKKEFFKCTEGFLKDSQLEWTTEEQKYHIEALKKKRYVIRIRHGIPGVRWLHINIEKLETDLDDLEESTSQSAGKHPDQSGGFYPERPGGFYAVNKDTTNVVSRKKEEGKLRASDPPALNGLLPKVEYSTEMKQAVRRIYEVVKKMNGSSRSGWNHNSESSGCRKLSVLQKRIKDFPRIERAIKCCETFVDCYKSKKLPHLDSIDDFCKRKVFQWIEDKADLYLPTEVVLSPDAKEILERISDLAWPQTQDLPFVVQTSLDNLRKFGKKADPLLKNPPENLAGFIENLSYCMPPGFVEWWFRTLHEKNAGWDGWDGDLKREIFDFEHKRFQSWGRRQSIEYCGHSGKWDSYAKAIKEID